MPVVFDFDPKEVRALPGDTARFAFRIHNDSPHQATYAFAMDAEGRFNSAHWKIAGPAVLQPGELASSSLDVDVPARGTAAGTYRLRLKVMPGGAEAAAVRECTLVVESKPHIRFLSQPQLHLNPDGSVTVTVPVAKRGDTVLDVSIEVRHTKGWKFECSRPDMHLGSHAGPFDVNITLRPPVGKSAKPGDEITIKVSYRGHTLISKRFRLPVESQAGSVRPAEQALLSLRELWSRVRRVWWAGATAMVLALAVTAISFGAVRPPPTQPPRPSPSSTITPPSSVPTGLRAVAVGPRHVYLSWFQPRGPVHLYQVNRDGGPARSRPTTTPSYDDTSVLPGRSYRYTVVAVTAGRPSGPSNEAHVITPRDNTPVTRSLVVTPAGLGSGSITSNPSGISCGSSCNSSFADGAAVILMATPQPGSVFAGWEGGGCSGNTSCVLALTANQAVTAHFDRAPAGEGVLEVSASSLDFGSQRVGAAGSPRTFVLTNRGHAHVAVQGVQITGTNEADFTFRDECSGQTLSAGVTCTIAVSFLASAPGARTAIISYSPTSARSLSVALTGTGLGALPVLDPPQLDFGGLPVGMQRGEPIMLRNLGNTPFTVRDARVVGPHSSDFIPKTACVGETVAPSSSCEMFIYFRPTAKSARSSRLELSHDAGPKVLVLNLTGMGETGQATPVADRKLPAHRQPVWG